MKKESKPAKKKGCGSSSEYKQGMAAGIGMAKAGKLKAKKKGKK